MSSKSTLSRRALIATAATLPAVALVDIPTAKAVTDLQEVSAIERLAAELAIACQRHKEACDRMEIADLAVFKWQKDHPMPELGEDDTLRTHRPAYEAWQREWKSMERESGHTGAQDANDAACDEVSRLSHAIAETPVRSLRALKLKATVAVDLTKTYDTDFDLAWSIVEDLVRLEG